MYTFFSDHYTKHRTHMPTLIQLYFLNKSEVLHTSWCIEKNPCMEVKRKKEMEFRDGIHFMNEKKSRNFFGSKTTKIHPDKFDSNWLMHVLDIEFKRIFLKNKAHFCSMCVSFHLIGLNSSVKIISHLIFSCFVYICFISSVHIDWYCFYCINTMIYCYINIVALVLIGNNAMANAITK